MQGTLNHEVNGTYLIIEEISTVAKMREKTTVTMAVIDPNIAGMLSTELIASGIPVSGREGTASGIPM